MYVCEMYSDNELMGITNSNSSIIQSHKEKDHFPHLAVSKNQVSMDSMLMQHE